jgi:hypothetical protein
MIIAIAIALKWLRRGERLRGIVDGRRHGRGRSIT